MLVCVCGCCIMLLWGDAPENRPSPRAHNHQPQFTTNIIHTTHPSYNHNQHQTKEEIARDVKEELQASMGAFGYEILQVLVTDIDPAPKVCVVWVAWCGGRGSGRDATCKNERLLTPRFLCRTEPNQNRNRNQNIKRSRTR